MTDRPFQIRILPGMPVTRERPAPPEDEIAELCRARYARARAEGLKNYRAMCEALGLDPDL